MMFRPGAWSWRVLFVALALSITWLAFAPRPPESIDTGWDKLNHLCAFASLALTGYFCRPASRAWWLVTLAALFAFGSAIEIVQSWLPFRRGEWEDLAADSLGIAVGLCTASLLLQVLRRRRRA
jgi:VanZ family protein